MRIEAIKTRPLMPPQDDLLAVLDTYVPKIEEKSVVVISSKVVAIWQGRCEVMPVHSEEISKRKAELTRQESEQYLERQEEYPYTRIFSVYEGVLGSSAGIDESNGDGHFVLPPKNTETAAKDIREHLLRRDGLTELGVIITDSRSRPMRNGVTAVSLAHAGFGALYDYRGKYDIFGRMLHFERINIADSLATAANLVMGEGDECTPIAVCAEIPLIDFTNEDTTDMMLRPAVAMHEDVFAQFFIKHPWQKGGNIKKKDE